MDFNLGLVLSAILLLILASHVGGHLARKLRQPSVIGEILGGLCLGPTLFGFFAPESQAAIFTANPSVATCLSLLYNFGLLLLMFLSGLEIERIGEDRAQLKSASIMAVTGTLIPMGIALLALPWIPLDAYMGPAQSRTALVLVFATAMAVTSLPVISKIFLDLGVMNTRFAKVVLSSSLLDDFLHYVLLAVALNAAGDAGSRPDWLNRFFEGKSLVTVTVVECGIHFAFVVSCMTWLQHFYRLFKPVLGFLKQTSPVALLLVILVSVSLFGLAFGVPPVLSAFAAGLLATRITEFSAEDRRNLAAFSSSFFIQIFFAMVGLKLNLIRDFDPIFFVVFLLAATGIKMLSVWVGARLSGVRNKTAVDLAVTMNARGGPGIVLASAALEGGIVNAKLYVSLVLLALVTSGLAGAWLESSLQKGRLNPNEI